MRQIESSFTSNAPSPGPESPTSPRQTLTLTALLSPPLGEVGRGSGRVGVVGLTTRPPRPLPDPLRVGGEADIVRIPVVLNPGLLGNQK